MRGTIFGLLLFPALAWTASAGEAPEPVSVIGKADRIDLSANLVPGKVTIFEFFSHWCPSCATSTPTVERLAREYPDFVLRKIDINREGVVGADFDSPVAQQYGLSAIPHFKIYDSTGKFRAEGREAYHQVLLWHWYFVEKHGK
ncbi:MAG: thioredoxin family protein, partial [Candidatus Wallbacteria bacterium]|nr:thioredoxin family protein [Candidatus Wallbacteria bacterium]